MTVAQHIVNILEDRGVQFVFGLPGEENIALVNALHKSDKIQFILVQDERSAGFMAGTIGWLTGEPGVAIATLGPGALNMVLSIADAHSHSFPMMVIAAQGDLRDRIRETSQVVNLKRVFEPISKWSEDLIVVESANELVNKAYNVANTERKGATFLTIPNTLEREAYPENVRKRISNPKANLIATSEAIEEATQLLFNANNPLIVAGLGVSRNNLSHDITQFALKHRIPVTTSFMAKGAIPESSDLSLGVVGFFIDDYISTYIEEVDLILAIGYDFAEFSPSLLNPNQDKQIINLHTFEQETHENFSIDSQLIGNMSRNLQNLSLKLNEFKAKTAENHVQIKLQKEYLEGQYNSETPLTPAKIVHATRQALPEQTKVFIDTGAVKMWMARLFPTDHLNTVLINNALSSMAWAIPGTIATKLLYPDIPLLTVMGDGAFNMSASEISTAAKYNIPLTILIWVDSGYGLIKWKMDMDLGEHSEVDFTNPDFIKIAEAHGGQGYLVKNKNELENILKTNLERDEGINIIVVPVDYRENMRLTEDLMDTQ